MSLFRFSLSRTPQRQRRFASVGERCMWCGLRPHHMHLSPTDKLAQAARGPEELRSPEFLYESSRTFLGNQKARFARVSSGSAEGDSPLPGFGVSPISSFPSRAAVGGEQKEKKRFLGTPQAPAGRTLHPKFWERFQKFGMTHNQYYFSSSSCGSS